MNSNELEKAFFTELRQYNISNFKTLLTIDLKDPSANGTICKSYSSAITRFFIFKEKHPELTQTETSMLYYKAKLDLVAEYFAQYPDGSTDNLIGFQIELRNFSDNDRSEEENEPATIAV